MSTISIADYFKTRPVELSLLVGFLRVPNMIAFRGTIDKNLTVPRWQLLLKWYATEYPKLFDPSSILDKITIGSVSEMENSRAFITQLSSMPPPHGDMRTLCLGLDLCGYGDFIPKLAGVKELNIMPPRVHKAILPTCIDGGCDNIISVLRVPCMHAVECSKHYIDKKTCPACGTESIRCISITLNQ